MRIPLYRNEFGEEEVKAVADVIRSGRVYMGEKVEELEDKFAKYVGAKYAIACSSCTTALHLAIESQKSKVENQRNSRNKIIVPAFTWISTANAVLYAGMEPMFCDIELDTFNMNMGLAMEMVDEKIRAIIPVHQFGCPLLVESGNSKVKSKREREVIIIIEDAACGLNARINGKHVGNFGLMGCFSFHPRKAITSGDGGMVVTNNRNVYDVLKSLRNHGQIKGRQTGKPYGLSEFNKLGFNYRMTELQAAMLIPQLKREKENYLKRKKIAEIYKNELERFGWFKIQSNGDGFLTTASLRPLRACGNDIVEHGWQSFVGLFGGEELTMNNVKKWNKKRNEFMVYMEKNGIMTRPGTYALHTTKFYKEKYGYKTEDFPNAYLAQECSVALPIFAGMKEREVEKVVSAILNYELK